MAGLGRDDVEVILGRMGGRERDMVMTSGGVGRMLGWDAMEGMLNGGNDMGNGIEVLPPPIGDDLHVYDEGLEPPGTPVNRGLLAASSEAATPVGMPEGEEGKDNDEGGEEGLLPGEVLVNYIAPVLVSRVRRAARQAFENAAETGEGGRGPKERRLGGWLSGRSAVQS